METPESETIALPTGPARVEWRRSQRARRVSLRIDPRVGAVVVTLPMRAGRRAGLALLTTHADWVADRLAALPQAVTLADGAQVRIGGIPHLIRHCPGARGGAWLADGVLHVSGHPEFLARRVGDFLRAEARRRLSVLVVDKARRAGLTHTRLTIKDTRTRWGSCAADGALAFSWRLVMAPDFALDYVAAHEVAHLRHMNHGPRFWALVDKLTVHRAQAIAWLNEEGPALLRVG
ncbi:MAG: M48 family metallopeptidase [Proteobacteria bacterium]|nr:M48 family metallopeptidase [Pseudomonadota bacterium]